MAILNPDHLLEQAERLIVAPAAGPPRQVDLRRAISACYYAVFHSLLRAAADEFVGVTRRNDPRYHLVYRSVDHAKAKDLCVDLIKPTMPTKYSPFTPTGGFGPNIVAFAAIFVDLQERRHAADYDPSRRFRAADALADLTTARTAIRRYARASATRRKAFVTLLLFPPKR